MKNDHKSLINFKNYEYSLEREYCFQRMATLKCIYNLGFFLLLVLGLYPFFSAGIS